MSFTPNLVVGFVITLMGAVLLLDRLTLLEVRTVLQYWPLLLTLFGVSVIVQSLRRGDGATEAGGRGRPIVSPGFVLILVVIWLVGTDARDRRFLSAGASGDPELSLLAVMGKDERASTSTAFRTAQMTTVMGRTRLDLREVTLADGAEATVDVLGVMGAVELFVPEGWEVDVRATAVMGRARDRRGAAPDEDDDDWRSRRERRRAARDRTSSTSAPASTSQPSETPVTPPTSPDTSSSTRAPAPGATSLSVEPASSGAASPTRPRLVVKGLIVAGALIIRS